MNTFDRAEVEDIVLRVNVRMTIRHALLNLKLCSESTLNDACAEHVLGYIAGDLPMILAGMVDRNELTSYPTFKTYSLASGKGKV